MADAAQKKSPVHGAKHTLCRRIGSCLWGMPNCPTCSRVIKTREGGEATSTARAYPAGQHGPTKRRGKLSTYGELLIEKQKLRTFYNLSEHQLMFIYRQSKAGEGNTGEKLLIEHLAILQLQRLRFFQANQQVAHGAATGFNLTQAVEHFLLQVAAVTKASQWIDQVALLKGGNIVEQQLVFLHQTLQRVTQAISGKDAW